MSEAHAVQAGNPNHKWYIVHAYSNFEKKVKESIFEQARSQGLEDAFSEILVPTEDVVEIRRGRKINSERKFFPGYVLVKMDLNDQTYHLVKNTPKVTGFLGSGSKPIPVSEREVARIIGAIEEGGGARQADDQLRDRREGEGHRRPVRFFRRLGGKRRRGPRPPARVLSPSSAAPPRWTSNTARSKRPPDQASADRGPSKHRSSPRKRGTQAFWLTPRFRAGPRSGHASRG